MRHVILILTFYWIIVPGRGVLTNSQDIDTPSAILTESSGQEVTRYVYVGAEACAGKCHNNDEMGHQYDRWKDSRHSKSYESLSTEKALRYGKEAGVTENPWESLTCLKCHVTASGIDSSSLGATYRKEDGVTCESCHKGEFIPKTFLPDEADCLKCHNDSVHEVSPFDFNDRCMRITHPRIKAKP